MEKKPVTARYRVNTIFPEQLSSHYCINKELKVIHTVSVNEFR